MRFETPGAPTIDMRGLAGFATVEEQLDSRQSRCIHTVPAPKKHATPGGVACCALSSRPPVPFSDIVRRSFLLDAAFEDTGDFVIPEAGSTQRFCTGAKEDKKVVCHNDKICLKTSMGSCEGGSACFARSLPLGLHWRASKRRPCHGVSELLPLWRTDLPAQRLIVAVLRC